MKKKLLIILFSIILICSCAIALAASVKIEYNYALQVETPIFTVSDGKLSVSISNTTDTSYKLDTSNSYVDILTEDSDTYSVSTKQKIDDLTLDSSKTYKVFANTLTYTKGKESFTVTYHNEYVSSKEELKTVNYSSYYNNIFNYSKNTNNLALRIIFIKAITLDEEITIKAPISITLLKSLTLKENLNIINSYAGNYDITIDKGQTISSSNESKVIINSTNANYKYDSNGIITLNESISLDSASEFIKSYLPSYLVNSVYLPKRFLSSDITYDYYVIDQDNTDTNTQFNGILSDYSSYIEDNILRIKTIVTSGNDTKEVTKDIICGNSIESLKLILEKELSATNHTNYDLLYLLNSLNIKEELTFKSGTGFDVIINNTIVSTDTTLTYDDANNCYKDSSDNITSIVFRRTSITDTSFTLNINSSDITINLNGATRDEVIEYVKTYIHAYIVTSENKAYDILNIKDNKIYLGTADLDIVTTNLFTNLNYKIVDSNDNEITYYTSDTTNGTITVDSTKEFTTLSLNYYDNETLLFSIPIKRSLSSNSGEDTGFESNNPFDSIFSSSTNWLKDNTFTMPSNSTYSAFYAKINITKINGVTYNTDLLSSMSVRGTSYSANTHKMISITQSGNTASNDPTYYKSIDFKIDYNYIPNFDSVIQVECLLYNNDAKEVTATHIYTFTIPGILKCGSNDTSSNYTPCVFTSDVFYIDILNYFKNNSNSNYYIDIDSNTSYILANAKNVSEISVSGNNDEISADGIEYFTYTKSIIINNYIITELSAFKYLTDSSLSTLNLDSNNITSDILSTYLYNIRLTTLSLKGNNLSGISSFKGLFFRTITSINLNNCSLTTINGIDSLVNLTTLYIESNNIDEFETLKSLDYLTDVYLYNNTNTNNYYGTSGLVNEVVYYWMTVTYNTVIHRAEENNDDYTISDDSNHNSILLYLNAVCIPTKMNNDEYNDLITNLKTKDIIKVSYTNNRLIVSYTSGNETLYREFYIEVTS